jgi:hypothetical protein
MISHCLQGKDVPAKKSGFDFEKASDDVDIRLKKIEMKLERGLKKEHITPGS